MTRLKSIFSFSPQKREAQELYIALVLQSRKAFFYTEGAVADTLDGRFDVILLHLFLALRALDDAVTGTMSGRTAPADFAGNKTMVRLLLERLFDDMDRSLREMGVGDMGVSRRMQAMSKAAFGRLTAYHDAYGDDAALKQALVRNLYRGETPGNDALQAVVDYVRRYDVAPRRATMN